MCSTASSANRWQSFIKTIRSARLSIINNATNLANALKAFDVAQETVRGVGSIRRTPGSRSRV
ncbi:MAG: hypothetical protein OJF50_003072 [Nitrospira sp.]|nr:hypothetical protein [Nitrospira sp.]